MFDSNDNYRLGRVCLMEYQLLAGYLMLNFDSYLNVCNHKYFYLVLFNGISSSYGLFDAEFWFISKCLIAIITIFGFV